MYTGTLISSLMNAAERANEKVQQQRMEDELHQIFAMQIPVVDNETAYLGAA